MKPLYAVAGATEIAYEFARGYAAEAQKTAAERFADVQNRVSKIERDPKALQNQAVSLVNARVDELQKDAKDAQSKFEARVAELQKDAQALPEPRSRPRSTTPSPSWPRPTPTSSTVARSSSPPSARTASRPSPRCARLPSASPLPSRRRQAPRAAADKAPAVQQPPPTKVPGNKSKPAAKKTPGQDGARAKKTAANHGQEDRGQEDHRRAAATSKPQVSA